MDISQKYEGLIDGGYLSFVYGSRNGYGGWFMERYKYKNFLMIMDSRTSQRAIEFPAYKSRRKDRREKDERSQQVYSQVNHFRQLLLEDTVVKTMDFPGYEADDVVALFFICYGPLPVIAVDKDFMMVPGMRKNMRSHKDEGPTGLKLPKYARRPQTSLEFALTQAIFGDKSDSIPRLLPSVGSHSKRLYQQIFGPYEGHELAESLYTYYGDDLIRNLRLVLLPHPNLAIFNEDFKSEPWKLLNRLVTGEYWEPQTWSLDLLENITSREEAYNDTEWENW